MILSRLAKYFPALVFLFLAGMVMWNLLGPGYIFAMDTCYGPSSSYNNFINHIESVGINLSSRGLSPLTRIIFFTISYLSDFIISAWMIQKVTLFLLLAFSGLTMYYFVPVKNIYARYFAAFLYMINPFVYVRFLSGSFWFLWGYAFLPLVVKSFINLLNEPNPKNIIISGLLLTLIAPSQHILVMAVGVFFLLSLFKLLGSKCKVRLTLTVLASIAVFIILNAGWIYSITTREALAFQSLRGITYLDLDLFSSSDYRVLFNIASMYGFWRGGYDYPQYHLPGWQFLFLFLLFFVIYGLIVGFKGRHGIYVKAMGFLIVISFVLAVGVSLPYFSKISYFLYDNVPLFGGFRDSQKFVAVLILAYAYLGSIGIDALVRDVAKLKYKGNLLSIALPCLTFTVIFLYGYTMFFGFHGYSNNTDYPKDYYEVNSLISQDKDDFVVLFLPWHQHFYLSWIGSNVSNPAEAFLSKPVIRGDNIELWHKYTESTNPVSKYIEALLQRKDQIHYFGEFVSPLKVKYIILAKEVDWEEYQFLIKQADLDIFHDSPYLRVFINRSYTELPQPFGNKPELLGLDTETITFLEESTRVHDKSVPPWLGYLPSGIFFIGCIIFLRWHR